MSAQLHESDRETGCEPDFCGMVGRHAAMLSLYDAVRRAAPLTAPVLIQGETGTGKELVARALHALSGRPGRFVAVNVATLPEALADAELFGVVKGAYTGATAHRRGLIEYARHGTLLLDEAGDIPLALQAKLLRALETNAVRPVGGGTDRVVPFRLVVSVQVSPSDLLAAARWRADFHFRVCALHLRVPRLIERDSDIPRLVRHFLGPERLSIVLNQDLRALGAHMWPGNVRELRQAVERAVFEHGTDPLAAEHILAAAAEHQTPHDTPAPIPLGPPTLREIRAQHIAAVLARAEYDVGAAARLLGISTSQLYRRLKTLGLKPQRRR
ncbi:MAG TPA: sigma 54-interacting transcriptional regulator [Gemmatimonadales bacterium]|nr:sigma 54-interacting transcriptional regulator [Gemmatimonadales bacterium]